MIAQLVRAVQRLFGGLPPEAPAAPAEPLALGVNAILCVCDEEWCFCRNLVPMPIRELDQLRELGIGIGLGNNPCAECRAGSHTWTMPATT